MNSPCDPADPIETLIDQIEDVIDCAASGDMCFHAEAYSKLGM